MNAMLNERINELKGSIHALWDRFSKSDETTTVSGEDNMDLDYERNYEDDLPLRLAREDGPNVRFYSTENSPLSIGAEKVEQAGIDSFGEDDSPDANQMPGTEY
jgi:hypothetical protein